MLSLRKFTFLTVIIALTVSMIACSGESGPVKVGSIMDYTGDLGEYGPPMYDAVALAASHINEAGGILDGRTIEVIQKDGATSDVTATDAARALVEVDEVSAIVGPLASGITLAVANAVTVPNGVLEISSSATAPSLTALDDNDFIFRTAPSDAFQGVVLARLAIDQGYKTAGVMYFNNAYGQGLSEQFKTTFESLGGSVTNMTPHEAVQPTYASEVAAVTEGDPDVLVAISYPESAGVYLREAIDSGSADTFLFVDGTKSQDLIKAVGAANLEGMKGTAPGAISTAQKDQFDKDYEGAHGEGSIKLPFIKESYDAMAVIALAIEKAGSTDSAKVRDALRSVANAPGEIIGPGVSEFKRAIQLIGDGKDINYQGASGPIEFDDAGDVNGAIEIWSIQNGELVTEKVVTE